MPDARPLVYLAGPYTKGDPAINTRCQLALADWLINSRLAWPVCPLLSHFQHTMFPQPYEDWLALDLALVARCDGLIRHDAVFGPLGYAQSESSGADREMALARSLGIPTLRIHGNWADHARYEPMRLGPLREFLRDIRPRVLAAPGGEVTPRAASTPTR